MGWLYLWALMFVINPAFAIVSFVPMVILALFVDVVISLSKPVDNVNN
jgi:hypothetical protein